jgi:hypothetical protein
VEDLKYDEEYETPNRVSNPSSQLQHFIQQLPQPLTLTVCNRFSKSAKKRVDAVKSL